MKSYFINLRFVVSVMTVLAIFAAVIFVFSPTQEAQVSVTQNPKATYQKFANEDEITRAIRSKDIELVRVEIRTPADHKAVAKYGRIVNDYGSFVIIAKKRGANINRSGLRTQPIERTVNLPGAKFDPLNEPPTGTVRPNTAEATGEKGYYIVQFGGIVNDEWLDSLRDVGVEFLQYVPHNAFFVYADGNAISKAAAHSRVRWTGAFLPEHKVNSVLTDQLNAAKSAKLPPSGISPLEMTGENTSIFDIAVFKRGDLERISNLVQSNYGGRVKAVIDLPGNYFNVVRAELTLDEVLRIAEIPDAITIDFYSRPRIEDERAAHIVAGNYTGPTTISGPGYNPLTQFGVNGLNVTISMVDDGVSIPGNGGFYVTSANTVDGPLRGAAAGATGGHGHINASIISGDAPFGILDPTGHNYGIGVAPKSHIINIPMLTGGYSGLEADAYNDTVVTNGPNGVRGSISNNSWGNGTNANVYDSYTAQFDGYVRDASAGGTIDPISLIFSAGNSGPGANTLTRPKAAKNIIATGNSENVRSELGSTQADNLEDLRSSSSRGPAADGRVKPDITAPGTVITGSRAGTCASVSSCFDANHAYSTGTSHAAPQIAGVAALFTEFWKNNSGGNNPSPALVKAAIINTAQEMTGVNVTAALPNGAEGWGRVNTKFMLNTGVAMKHVNQTTAFSDPGNNITYAGTVADASKPIRISLVWTDPPGAANANPALVNNLDLTVILGANTYRGNVFTGGVSTTGGSADTLNNVENIFLPAGAAAGTPFSIQISATAINGDGILGNADTTDQHFALVTYNFSESLLVTRRAPFDYDGDDRTDLSIFRPAAGEWWYQRSSTGIVSAGAFGTST
ncbi:MAG: S8 family serine peptidase, partial [Pyrinomonadaceae bacterium]